MIPNVSSIYRDLACMADPQSFRGEQTYSNKTSQNTVYVDKQQRHNQLMDKLRNAQRQMGSINSEISNQGQPTISYKSTPYQQYRPQFHVQEIDRCQTPFFNQPGAGRSWKPPNIRYRHIQDFKHQSPIVPQVPLAEVNREQRRKEDLEQQFYDEPQMKERRGSKKENGTSVDPVIKEKVNESDIEKESDLSYGRTWVNRESKFQDKLQSYYELCKKRPGSSKIEPKERTTGAAISRSKFERSTGTKTIGLDLEKAIKMLSFD